MTTQGPTQADNEKAQSLIPCNCGTKSHWHLIDCPRHSTAWEDIADALAAAREQAEKKYEKEERDHERTIEQRDDAEQALSQAYYLVTGRSPEWSNHFGYADAHQDITDAINAFKSAAREQGRAEADASIPAGHIKDYKGVVRRVLGTLPVTADGCIASGENEVFHPDSNRGGQLMWGNPDSWHADGWFGEFDDTGNGDWKYWPIADCYSTREAALAARGNT